MRQTIAIIIMALAILLFAYQTARADSLQGVVVNESGKGIPGLTVSLARPDFRTAPSITDSLGHYSFPNIRAESYYLEVYWGSELLYRKSISIQGSQTAEEIKLQR
jgi:Carboxypeptidase regulatory-like domain